MKVEISIDDTCEETTVLIRAKELSCQVNELVRALSDISGQQSRVLVGFKDGNATVMDITSMIRIYTSNQKVYFVTEQGEYTARLRLYQLEERLPRKTFIRISNTEIVNLQKVRDFDLSFSGSICVRFLDGTTTYVSRRYGAKIKKALGL